MSQDMQRTKISGREMDTARYRERRRSAAAQIYLARGSCSSRESMNL